jgi:hypothetical protein
VQQAKSSGSCLVLNQILELLKYFGWYRALSSLSRYADSTIEGQWEYTVQGERSPPNINRACVQQRLKITGRFLLILLRWSLSEYGVLRETVTKPSISPLPKWFRSKVAAVTLVNVQQMMLFCFSRCSGMSLPRDTQKR